MQLHKPCEVFHAHFIIFQVNLDSKSTSKPKSAKIQYELHFAKIAPLEFQIMKYIPSCLLWPLFLYKDCHFAIKVQSMLQTGSSSTPCFALCLFVLNFYLYTVSESWSKRYTGMKTHNLGFLRQSSIGNNRHQFLELNTF